VSALGYCKLANGRKENQNCNNQPVVTATASASRYPNSGKNILHQHSTGGDGDNDNNIGFGLLQTGNRKIKRQQSTSGDCNSSKP